MYSVVTQSLDLSTLQAVTIFLVDISIPINMKINYKDTFENKRITHRKMWFVPI